MIAFDPDDTHFSNQFCGEFVDLTGGADFYAADPECVEREGNISLKIFLDMCREDGVEPRKSWSGKQSMDAYTAD